jgi:hypothetical protein
MEKADIESIPIEKTFDIKDEKDAYDAAEEMVRIGFYKEKKGFKILMPKEPKQNAKRIGYIVTTTVTSKLRKEKQHRDVRYWTYHHDKEHYGIVLFRYSESLSLFASMPAIIIPNKIPPITSIG